MVITDLWGEGTTLSGGILSIPRSQLATVGLSPTNTDKRAIAVAAILLSHLYFEGVLVDHDGSTISDDNGDALAFDQNRNEMAVNFEFVGKQLSLDETRLFWDYIISFFAVNPNA